MDRTILTADDSASMRQMVTFPLKGAGYEVVEAVDGQDGLDRLSMTKVDMIITDLNMPNMDGIEMIRNVRTMPQYKFIPIILLTTESQDTKKKEGKAEVPPAGSLNHSSQNSSWR